MRRFDEMRGWFLGVATLMLFAGCTTAPDGMRPPELAGEIGQWADDDDDPLSDSRYGSTAPLVDGLTAVDHTPSGEIVLDDRHLTVEVGDELWLSFSADLWEIDPAEAYFTFENVPEGVDIDADLGELHWIPTDHDLGAHIIGIDLWYETDQRVLDAQRIRIDVVPQSDPLIEVGI